MIISRKSNQAECSETVGIRNTVKPNLKSFNFCCNSKKMGVCMHAPDKPCNTQ